MDKNWSYLGIFFDGETQKKLLSKAKEYVNIEPNWKIFCHHITLIYNDGSDKSQRIAEAYEKLFGEKKTVTVTNIGISDRAIAFAVDVPTNNNISHVTVAVAPDAKPVESNQITKWKKIDPFIIEGVIGKFDKKRRNEN